MLEYLKEIDQQLFLYLNGIHSPAWDTIMFYISDKFIWVPFYLLLVGFIIYKFKKKAVVTIVFAILLITLIDQLAVHLFKEVFERLRPCHNPEISHLVHLVKDHCGGKYGFVSNHAANTFGLAMFTTFLFRNARYTFFIFLWASIVSYSRIYLGVHYPGDVLGGAVFGILLGYLIFYLYRQLLGWLGRNWGWLK